MVPPFVWIRGQLFIVANWGCEMPEDGWLLLRPATREELDNYLARVGDAEVEAYYSSILVDRDRLVGRSDVR